ncbi:hypothetical protein ACQW02_00105 [Humitalea sp. 24SJ18S-53]|uniref:hypothetical protein n=1 Tax=Humitalea sp. 24SJ18S-53 TaxID=3422307 RepID=UPI003D67B8CB
MSDDISGFNSPHMKIARARTHFDAYWTAFRRLEGTGFLRVTLQPGGTLNSHNVVVDENRPIPADLRLNAADVLYNLRSALDQAACCCVPEGKKRSTYFPHGEDKQSFQKYLAEKFKASASARDAIVKIEPYYGGKGYLIRALHDLNVLDKHVQVLSKNYKIVITGAEPRDGLPLGLRGSPADAANPEIQNHYIQNDGLTRDGPKVWIRVAFTFSAVLQIAHEPITLVLEKMSDLVASTVNALEDATR